MMTSLPVASPAPPLAPSIPLQSLGAAAALAALADFLFYLYAPGISIVLFAIGLSAAALATNQLQARLMRLLLAAVLLAAALLPAIEAFSISSLAFAAIGAAAFVLIATGWSARPATQRLFDIGVVIASGPLRLASDVGVAAQEAWGGDGARRGGEWLMAWVVPVGLGAVFLFLFAMANPLIEQWFTFSGSGWANLDLVRPLFWLAVVALTWSFLRVRLNDMPNLRETFSALDTLAAGDRPIADAAPELSTDLLLSDTAIIRSLILFNALFSVQSALDIVYLWGHVALPAGTSYAAYAHRGAYPLMVTALLAGAFVLVAMRPGTQIERSWAVRDLVFAFIGQNVLLVLSSMLRLDLYVHVYSLTGWRCAAFIWMMLVAVGLVLIVARIAFGRSNTWLVWSNAAVLALTLYACSFVDFSGEIASFNVRHSREVAGIGEPIDVAYLCGLGPTAIPAFDLLAAKLTGAGFRPSDEHSACRAKLEATTRKRMEDWRAWSFRDHRLMRYLQGHSVGTAAEPNRSTT